MENLVTESESNHQNLENKSFEELISAINSEDVSVAQSVRKELHSIVSMAKVIFSKLANNGRLFYIGSGTSGRLGIFDASECPPTFGVGPDKIIGIIAGGDNAIRKAMEGAEDNTEQAILDLQKFDVNKNDFVLGISASGKTPYVLGGLQKAKQKGIDTGALSCNKNSLIGEVASYKIEIEVGPELLSGSTRMKAGTAQKMALNMLSTSLMIKLGHVKGNRMIDMQLSNQKLVDRGTRIIVEETGWDEKKAKTMLLQMGSVRKVLERN
ncbi:MAG: N-acetylmuramic acid 6-phosphate etherase [Bacteroidota bacterium]|nr:N-acetylmuramic acid 6-phosphate etherase [Bacteroidota bacterium]